MHVGHNSLEGGGAEVPSAAPLLLPLRLRVWPMVWRLSTAVLDTVLPEVKDGVFRSSKAYTPPLAIAPIEYTPGICFSFGSCSGSCVKQGFHKCRANY